ncbi:hypothetical protein DEO72_LG4g124 [Vigna unguiculata]|uniref:Uncharacterized protein n=1 Tax=Vigna unguiculata TaxID=3917 RepID=A0A4D6LLJ7_VIGUN|nr:hypothetical protein DEO72_LG4g124 [Vigna unguiculata]
MYDLPMLFLHYFEGFWVFPRNRLAAQPLPPSDTSEVNVVLVSGMNRLAAMSICQAARRGVEKPRFRLVLVYRLAALGLPPGDGERHLAARGNPPGDSGEIGALHASLAPDEGDCTARRSGLVSPGGARCCTMSGLVHGWWLTCDDMRGEVHIQLLSCGDTSEVRRVGLRAGRFVEARPRAGSSPFLFVYGDDRVIRYTGADVYIGDAEDAQATE